MARVPIPPALAAEVLFGSQRTCCVCRDPGKPVQIHHIDEDHANNDRENLAVLCLSCHHETQTSGGFARHLDGAQVRQFRDDWAQRVRRRRDDADRLATEVMAAVTREPPAADALQVSVREAVGISEAASTAVGVGSAVVRPRIDTWDYVRTLPELKRRAYTAARSEWDSGVTARMVEASYRVIDVMQDILANLAARYPTGHFDVPDPRDYISELIATRFRWHRYHHEPDGHGKNGTIVLPMIASSVLTDAENMVAEMVRSLTLDWSASTDYDFRAWREEWLRPERELPHIDVSVSDGKSVVVTAINKGVPFTLLLRSQILKSNHPIDHGYPFEYVPRKVSSGDVIKNYTIAETREDRTVLLFGEGMSLMQVWRPTWQQGAAFEIGLTFLAKEDGFIRTISEYVVSVALETGTDRMKAAIELAEHRS
jgi:hypothetical protein